MEKTSLNTASQLRETISPIQSRQLESFADAMRQGKPVESIQIRLQRLDLIARAAAYWSPADIEKANIYLKLFANV